MSVFDDFIAEKTASGNLTSFVEITSPDGIEVMYYIDPVGRDYRGDIVPALFRVFEAPNGQLIQTGGTPIAVGTELVAVETPLGLGIEYEGYRDPEDPGFAPGGIYRITVMESSNGFFPGGQQDILDRYTGNSDDVGFNSIGGSGMDDLFGTGLDDVMYGKGGADYMEGAAGNDQMYGGAGKDEMFGEAGDDLLVGNDGADTMYGGAGDDVLKGGTGADKIVGGLGNDYLLGGESSDGLFAGAGEDELRGGDGGDNMHGGDGADLLRGNKGDDALFGGKSNDVLKGDANVDYLYGGGGKDELFGGTGSDYLTGGAHKDELTGGKGSDTFIFNEGDGRDTITDFNADNDMIDLSGFETTFGEVEINQTGSSVLVHVGDVYIRLQDTDVADITDDVFLF